MGYHHIQVELSRSHRFHHIDAAYHAHSKKLPQEGPDLVDGSKTGITGRVM